MCGVAGMLNLKGGPASRTAVRHMTAALAHRGPDGDGFWSNGPIAFGHRRLSIIDLSAAGRQPMITRDGRYVISYNGEVFNFQELRAELEALGWQFRSQTDSEVVLNAFAQWGIASLDRFNGMFAFALWDRQENELNLVRDRYGIKPIYYYCRDGLFLFASEVKGILQHPKASASLNPEGLAEYLTFQNFFTGRTLFSDVRLLAAGSYLTIRAGQNEPSISTYWDYAFEETDQSVSDEEYLEELDRLFRQAVSRQLVSDVDVGAYLSGGMDSGSVTALAARELPYMRSFTCGFDLTSASGVELSFDERATAEHMSYVFKTEHYEMVLKAGDMERVLPRMTWHLEEPRVGQSYPNFYAAQLAGKFVKVVLSGAGGDELFGGYPWRYYRAVVNDDFSHYIEKYYQFWQRLIPEERLPEVLRPIWNQCSHVSGRDIFRDVFHDHAAAMQRPEDYVNHSLYFEAKTFLHGLLVVEDKLSMAHSLETRVPFLDNDLVDFAMKVPARLKLGNLTEVVSLNENVVGMKTAKYFQKTRDGKLLLRRMMGRYIPDMVAQREKQGFSAPDASWFKGESIEYVKRVLYNRRARIYDFIDARTVHELVDDHLQGRSNRRLLIWSLLNLEHWCRHFLDGESGPIEVAGATANVH